MVEEKPDTSGVWHVARPYNHGPDGRPLVLEDTPVTGTKPDETHFYSVNPHGDTEALTGLVMAGMFAAGKLEKIVVADALKSADEVAETNKKVPNPWGRRGSPNHVPRIQEAEERFADRGWKTVAGRSLPEEKYGKRYPDLVMQKGGRKIAIQVGRTTTGGLPVIRERRAMSDLVATDKFDHVFFLRYTP